MKCSAVQGSAIQEMPPCAPARRLLWDVGAGAAVHKHYFERKGVKDARQQELIRRQHGDQYALFGSMAFLFCLVPVVNYALFYANVAGEALWAADLEVVHLAC